MGQLTHKDWVRVVLVAGIGTILEWYDFYVYAQLTSTLKKVFFPASDPSAQALAFWSVYAVGFIVRPLGALIFGYIGDKYGRNRTLTIAIVCMAVPTCIIGCLPTYGVGSYTARPPIAAPIALALMRMLQGLAMGGEFGSAVIYISELAGVRHRGKFVATLQMTVPIGMILATALVMILENTISPDNMLIYGWRIPFLIAFGTAILGYFMRRGLPEPKAFLAAARAEKEADRAASAEEGGAAAAAGPQGAPSEKSVSTGKAGSDGSDGLPAAEEEEELEERFDSVAARNERQGGIAALHGHSHSKIPLVRVLRNNWLGLALHVLFMAWISGAFYCGVTWLPAELHKAGMAPLMTQGILVASLFFNAAGLLAVGHGFDRGMNALRANAALVVTGVGMGFGVYYGVWRSTAAAWVCICLLQLVVGAGMAAVALPMTRVYSPLERTTGFSFGYNFGYGVLGGLTPIVITAIQKGMAGSALYTYGPAFWLLALGALSLLSCACMRAYNPRLNQPFIGRIE